MHTLPLLLALTYAPHSAVALPPADHLEPVNPQPEPPAASAAVYDPLFGQGGSVTLATGVPFLAIGEAAWGFGDRFTIGALAGVTPNVLGVGLRPRVLVLEGKSDRLQLVAPVLYYPETSDGAPWLLTRPMVEWSRAIGGGVRVGLGAGFVAATAVGANAATRPYSGATGDARGISLVECRRRTRRHPHRVWRRHLCGGRGDPTWRAIRRRRLGWRPPLHDLPRGIRPHPLIAQEHDMRLFLFATTFLLGGCVLRASPANSNETCGSAVDPLRELEIVDDDTLARLSQNAENGPLSFRHIVETIAGDEVPSATFTEAWMHALGPDVEREVRAAWISTGPLDLARAPWRLVAVANRMDLAGKPRLGPLGEGRLVFGLTEGPADDPASAPRETTLIVEFALPTTRTATEWAHAWHALGDKPLGSVAYDEALAHNVASFATRPSLSQVRWNDPVNGLRQLDLGAQGMLVVAPLRNTPPRALDGARELAAFAQAHAAEIARDDHLLPAELLTTSTHTDARPWSLSDVADEVRDAFALGTCGGCHAHDAIDGGFHVSPLRHGGAKLSPMLKEDLGRRAVLLRRALCDESAQ